MDGIRYTILSGKNLIFVKAHVSWVWHINHWKKYTNDIFKISQRYFPPFRKASAHILQLLKHYVRIIIQHSPKNSNVLLKYLIMSESGRYPPRCHSDSLNHLKHIVFWLIYSSLYIKADIHADTHAGHLFKLVGTKNNVTSLYKLFIVLLILYIQHCKDKSGH